MLTFNQNDKFGSEIRKEKTLSGNNKNELDTVVRTCLPGEVLTGPYSPNLPNWGRFVSRNDFLG